MTPYQQAQALYTLYPDIAAKRTLEQDLALHAAHGFAWCSPTAVVLAKLTHSSLSPEEMAKRWLHPEQADSWFVYLAAGDLREFFRVAPLKLPWVVFYRRGKLRRYPMARMESRAARAQSLSSVKTHKGRTAL